MSKFWIRFSEIVTPLLGWFLLTAPFWASFFLPTMVVYFILVFDIYFLYKAATLGINSIRSYLKIRSTTKIDWLRKLAKAYPDYEKVKHFVFIPTYKEPQTVLDRTLSFLAEQEFPAKNIVVVLAGEDRDKDFLPKANDLKIKFENYFFGFLITSHTLKEGEVAGKSSNQNYAVGVAKEYITEKLLDKNFLTLTSCDADVSIHPKYFSNVTYLFLKNPNRYTRFWQGALVFYNNIWRVPLPVRVVHTLYSVMGIAELMRARSNFIYSTYTGSWLLLEKTGFWDTDVISEDWHLFFKAFFATDGQVELEPVFLPLYGDATEGHNYWSSLLAQYQQNRRWAWGVIDISYALSQFIKHRKSVSIPNFILRFIRALEQHLLWPVNWWVITLGASIPPLLNSQLRYTTLGFYLPKLSGIILTGSTIFLICIIIIDWLLRPPRPAHVKKPFMLLTILQYLTLPVTGFIFGALPGMDAHTRLLFGKRLEYKVTEKFDDKKN